MRAEQRIHRDDKRATTFSRPDNSLHPSETDPSSEHTAVPSVDLEFPVTKGSDMLKWLRSGRIRYGTAVALVLVAIPVKLYFIQHSPSLPFVIGVLLGTWYCGMGPGLLAAMLASSLVGWFFAPNHSVPFLIETALGESLFVAITRAIAKIYEGHLKTADAVLGLSRTLEDRDRKLLASEQHLQNEIAIQKAILNSIGEGVVVTDAAGSLLVFNPAAQEVLGADHKDIPLEAWPEHFGLYLPDTVTPYPRSDLPLSRALRGHAADGVQVFLRHERRPEGAWLAVSARPVRDANGSSKGAVAVFRDITADKRAEHDHYAAREAAEQANRAKSDFLSRMSHELRTPLNSILGFAQVLQLSELGARQRESVEYILKGGHHLLGLINEVLDIARIEAGRLSLSPEPVRIGDALEHALQLVQPMAQDRGITINLAMHCHGDQHVSADRQRLAQVLLNLLSNAVKYNLAGGSVDVMCGAAGEGRFRVSIADTGAGIAPAGIGKLFSPFERLNADQLGVEGTGLGLALSKRLIEAMGGSIGVESIVGQGSTFWLELSTMDDPIKDIQDSSDTDLSALAARTKKCTGTILYIEDNLSNLRLMEYIMENRPEIRLMAAMQGQLGLELAFAHSPDLILLDLHLPDLGGDQVLKLLRQNSRTGSIPVVMVSADATPGQVERLLEAGATGYLTKPLNVAKLLALIERTLTSSNKASANGTLVYAGTDRSK